jgi:hypothetical protein
MQQAEKGAIRGTARRIGSLNKIDRFECDYRLAAQKLEDAAGPFLNAAAIVK